MTASASPSPSANPPRPTASPAELRRKAHAKLLERIDLARARFKPLSLLRADARRVLEAFCDQEVVSMTRTDRDRLIEDYLAESAGFGPLEELFRDEAIQDILIVAAGQVIGRKGEVWSPTSSRFRDAEQLRGVLGRWFEVGEQLVPGQSAAGFTVRLANGFRVVAILPPSVMELSPQALLTRGPAVPVTPPAQGGSGSVPGGSGVFSYAVRQGSSGLRSTAAGGSGRLTGFNAVSSGPGDSAFMPQPPMPAPPSGSVSGVNLGAPASGTSLTGPASTVYRPAPVPPAAPDPFAKIRQRVTERIIMKFAAAGVYDLNQIPLPELRRIVIAHVADFCSHEKLGYDEAGYDRLALEILSGMNR